MWKHLMRLNNRSLLICEQCLRVRLYRAAQFSNLQVTNSRQLNTSANFRVPLPTVDSKYDKDILSLWERTRQKFGFLPLAKHKLNTTAINLHKCCVDDVDFMQFFHTCKLPDTMYSWFLVVELHVWMTMVRLMCEGKQGKTVRDCLLKNLWADVDFRAKKISSMNHKQRRKNLNLLNEQFRAAILSYDEALMSDDKVLASALWRIFFSYDPDADPEALELIVAYVRKNVSYLDRLGQEEILINGQVEWRPLGNAKSIN